MPYRPYAVPVSSPGSQTDVQSVVRELAQDFSTAFNTGNYDQCAKIFTPDGFFMVPSHEAVQGAKAIERSLQHLADLGYQDLRLETIRVDSSVDMAVEIGRYTVSIQGAKGVTLDRGKYLTAWRRLGAWLKVADCWSSDLASSAEKQLPDSHGPDRMDSDVPRSA